MYAHTHTHTHTHNIVHRVFFISTAEIIKLNVVRIEFVCGEGGRGGGGGLTETYSTVL